MGRNLRISTSLDIKHRANIKLARLQDESLSYGMRGPNHYKYAKGLLANGSSLLNVVELFAGAGGMGLGFLMARRSKTRFRLVLSGEIHPIYVETLKRNHNFLARWKRDGMHEVVDDPIPLDLEKRKTLDRVISTARNVGGVDILIGGPPCQGFSSANRNSGSCDNPNNRLVKVFIRYVDKLRPPIFLMENVQGIVWTAKNNDKGALSVAEHVLRKMKALGYLVFPKLLDAVWYGVPQYRTRFFLLGIHKTTGYSLDDFGDWGPFPAPTHGPTVMQPFITVREAIADLPEIENGQGVDTLEYIETATKTKNTFLKTMRRKSPRKIIHDHVTSRHADYVIRRYSRIPAGGNWQNISSMMSNYAQLERTHSNIYKRLLWGEPSITIGHYRKSMLIHPEQHRGLSLREACRLQSFPDWFRFAGTEDGRPGGLTYKQQQLANAVCPLVSKAIAEFILTL